MRNLYLRQDLNPILVAIMLSMFLKLHTLLSTFLRGTGTKTLLYGILKLQNRPKKPISVPEYLSIYILESVENYHLSLTLFLLSLTLPRHQKACIE